MWNLGPACHRRALAVAREFGDRHGEAYNLVGLGEAHRLTGRLAEAVLACQQALVIERETAHRWGEGHALHCLGKALHCLGDHQQARARWLEAVRCFQEIGAPDDREVLALLGPVPATESPAAPAS